MANFIVSYDLNGPRPSHAEMDKHMEKAGWSRARILETVWYVGANANYEQVFDYVNSILSKNDQLIVIDAREAIFRNLLVSNQSLVDAWNRNR